MPLLAKIIINYYIGCQARALTRPSQPARQARGHALRVTGLVPPDTTRNFNIYFTQGGKL